MQRTRKILVTVGIAVGAVGLGAVASAAVDNISSDEGDNPSTSTTEATTTTFAPATTDEPATTAAPTTTVDETAPTSPDTTLPDSDVTEPVDELPGPDAAPDGEEGADGPPDAALFGQCTAFSGRAQPGDSEAWQRLHERADGDIDGFCEGVLGERADRRTGPKEGRPGRGGPPGFRGRGPN